MASGQRQPILPKPQALDLDSFNFRMPSIVFPIHPWVAHGHGTATEIVCDLLFRRAQWVEHRGNAAYYAVVKSVMAIAASDRTSSEFPENSVIDGDCAVSCIWCAASDSNGEASRFERPRYASSHQPRAGADPRSRTGMPAGLSRRGIPFPSGPRVNWWPPSDSNGETPGSWPGRYAGSRQTAAGARSGARLNLVAAPGFEPGNTCF